ncbi:Dynein heavy chain 3, axonemal [Nymphon striatum]|nr:Dynein heavy chain 3, axonemal [Nymphon striatum]
MEGLVEGKKDRGRQRRVWGDDLKECKSIKMFTKDCSPSISPIMQRKIVNNEEVSQYSAIVQQKLKEEYDGNFDNVNVRFARLPLSFTILHQNIARKIATSGGSSLEFSNILDFVQSHKPNIEEFYKFGLNISAIQYKIRARCHEIYGTRKQRSLILYPLFTDNQISSETGLYNQGKVAETTIRAPVYWNDRYTYAKKQLLKNLVKVDPLMIKLKDLWQERFDHLRFVNLNEQFLDFVHSFKIRETILHIEKGIESMQNTLMQEWIPACAELFNNCNKAHCNPAVYKNRTYKGKLLNGFRMLMSFQLRSLVNEENGNPEVKMQSIIYPFLNIDLFSDGKSVIFRPHPAECQNMILSCVHQIIACTRHVPTVEKFLNLNNHEVYLFEVNSQDVTVQNYIKKLQDLFLPNSILLEKYLVEFKKENEDILMVSRDTYDVLQFDEKAIAHVTEKIFDLNKLKKEKLYNMDEIKNLGAYCVHYSLFQAQFNDLIQEQLEECQKWLIHVTKNKCQKLIGEFTKISNMLEVKIVTTEDLVEMDDFVNECFDETIYELEKEVKSTLKVACFVVVNMNVSQEDRILYAEVYKWPSILQKRLIKQKSLLIDIREVTENKISKQVKQVNINLISYQQQLELFHHKYKMSDNDVKANCNSLHSLQSSVAQIEIEIKNLNHKETLLSWQPTYFNVIHSIKEDMSPYLKMWTALSTFIENQSKWLKDSFSTINCEEVCEELDNLYRLSEWLIMELSEQIKPRKVAETLKIDIEKFQQYIPVLNVLCNPGLKDRHWTAISDEMKNEELKNESSETTSLFKMLQLNVMQHLPKFVILFLKLSHRV